VIVKNKLYNEKEKNLGHLSLNIFKTLFFYNTLTLREMAAYLVELIPVQKFFIKKMDFRQVLWLTPIDSNGKYKYAKGVDPQGYQDDLLFISAIAFIIFIISLLGAALRGVRNDILYVDSI